MVAAFGFLQISFLSGVSPPWQPSEQPLGFCFARTLNCNAAFPIWSTVNSLFLFSSQKLSISPLAWRRKHGVPIISSLVRSNPPPNSASLLLSNPFLVNSHTQKLEKEVPILPNVVLPSWGLGKWDQSKAGMPDALGKGITAWLQASQTRMMVHTDHPNPAPKAAQVSWVGKGLANC